MRMDKHILFVNFTGEGYQLAPGPSSLEPQRGMHVFRLNARHKTSVSMLKESPNVSPTLPLNV
mgnify:CR=1 FL=1